MENLTSKHENWQMAAFKKTGAVKSKAAAVKWTTNATSPRQ